MRPIILLNCFLLVLFVQISEGKVVKIDPMEPEKMVQFPQEDWLTLTVMGEKIGYAHIYTEKSQYRGEEAIRTRMDVMMEFKRSGTGLQLETTKIHYVGMDFVPRYFISTSKESGHEKRVEGEIKDGSIYLKTTLAGETTQSQKLIPPDTIFEETLGYLMLQRGISVGDEYTLSVFNTELMRPVETQVKVVRGDTVEFGGESKPAIVIDYLMDIFGGFRATAWLGLDGTTYRMETGIPGMKIVLSKVDMETALGKHGELDVIINTKIFSQGIQPIQNARYFKARLRLNGGNLDEVIVKNGRQKLHLDEHPGSGTVEIEVSAVNPSKVLNLPIQADASQDLEEFLKSTVYIQSNQPTLKAKAIEIVNGEIDAWKASKKLCRWVHTNIYDKNLRIGFGSALQTLESLEGDCTEHTVLLIALARSVDIPARACMGLVFQRDAFYYHFWPEVYVGEWVAMEPTLGQIQADANRIQLSGGQIESNSMMEFGEGVMRTLNQLEIEVIQ